MRGITLRKQLMDGEQNLFFQYLDFLATRNISYTATWSERARYEKRLALKVNDGPQQGPINDRDVFSGSSSRSCSPPTAKSMGEYLHPENERERQRPFDVRSNLEWQSWNWNVNQSQASSSSSTWWHEPQKRELQDQEWLEEW